MEKKEIKSTRFSKKLVIPALICSGLFLVTSLFLVDLKLHKKFDKMATYNYRGYRGPVLGRKTSDEIRVAVFGASTVFGYSVLPNETLPFHIENQLRNSNVSAKTKWSVINLGQMGTGVISLKSNLKTFNYLDWDLAVFAFGYVDSLADASGGPYAFFPLGDDLIFNLTGYYPIFPVIFKEKAMALRYGNDLSAAYLKKDVVVMPTLKDRLEVGILEATVRVGEAMKAPSAKALEKPSNPGTDMVKVCRQYAKYCEALRLGINDQLARGKPVLIVTEPYYDQNHRNQQDALRALLGEYYHDSQLVSYLNLGDTLDSKDPKISFDRLHFTDYGNKLLATHYVQPILNILRNKLKPQPSGGITRR